MLCFIQFHSFSKKRYFSIIMPNHIHEIIIINNPVGNGPVRSSNKYQQLDNLSVIIRSYKSTTSKQINKINNNNFNRQKSFYDHIIRTNKSLDNIRKHIIDNPLN